MIKRPHSKNLAVGFTLLEVVIVVAIMGVMLTMAIVTYSGQANKFRLNGDVKSLEASLQAARLRAISENVNAGIVFARRDGNVPGKVPDCYFLFIDSNSNGTFDIISSGSTPFDNLCGEFDENCIDTVVAGNGDLVLQGPLPQNNTPGLNNGEYFSRILNDSTDNGGGGAVYVSVVFTPMGAAMQNGVVLSGTDQERSICVQNHIRIGKQSDEAITDIDDVQTRGVSIQGPTGMVKLHPFSHFPADPTKWECIN